jgi:hypothetical protein
MSEENNNQPKLHEVQPRENVGRDTISRYQSQFRAAAYECLSLLGDDTLDRVYCDYQDDYVARFYLDGKHIYSFNQVKTKKKLNHQWSINELFGIRKKAKTADPEKIANSYLGKLLVHTIKFNNSCGAVVFLTNIHFNDDVETLMNSISDDGDNNYYKLLLDNFNNAFSPEEPIEDDRIIELIKKLNLVSNQQYLNPHDDTFSALARETVYKYSEIDLHRTDSEEIINNLVALVERKSFSKLVGDIDESDLDGAAGISLEDMLEILSISKGAYKTLKDGGDSNAIKNASIIHRLMSRAGASEVMIEFVSNCKVNWDIWFREKRHTMAEFDLNFLQEDIGQIASNWSSNKDSVDQLKSKIDDLYNQIVEKNESTTLNKELLLGAVFSAIVRNEA